MSLPLLIIDNYPGTPGRFAFLLEVESDGKLGWRQLVWDRKWFSPACGKWAMENWKPYCYSYKHMLFRDDGGAPQLALKGTGGPPVWGGFPSDLTAGNYGCAHIIGLPDVEIGGNAIWAVVPWYADPATVWIGAGVKWAGQAAVAGAETALAWMFNCAGYSQRFFFQVESFRAGPGLGGSAGIFAVIATGLSSPSSLTGMEFGGFDFTASLGKDWGKLLGALKDPSTSRPSRLWPK